MLLWSLGCMYLFKLVFVVFLFMYPILKFTHKNFRKVRRVCVCVYLEKIQGIWCYSTNSIDIAQVNGMILLVSSSFCKWEYCLMFYNISIVYKQTKTIVKSHTCFEIFMHRSELLLRADFIKYLLFLKGLGLLRTCFFDFSLSFGLASVTKYKK